MSIAAQQNSNMMVALNDSQWALVNQLSSTLSSQQLNWLSGYLAGLAQSGQSVQAVQSSVANDKKLTILYGSQTGNAKSVAAEFKALLEAKNIPVTLSNMADYKAKQLKAETHLVVIASTHGEGDAPDDAVELHEFLASKKAVKLPDLKFSVLGLGDSSYEFFCQTGKDFDQRLADLGAKRIIDRVDCDVDYDDACQAWFGAVIAKISDELLQQSATPAVTSNARAQASNKASVYNKKNPFSASLLESQKITGRDSVKDIRHIEISLEGSGIQYRPGDALGVWFKNDAALVDELLQLLSIQPSATVELAGAKYTVRDALINQFELTQSYPTFISAYSAFTQNKQLIDLATDKEALRTYLASRQIVDIVREYPAHVTAQQLLDCLRKITPRLYSIASSQDEVEDEVHLTVALLQYDNEGNLRQGGASSYLAARLEAGGELGVFVEHNDNFRLPDDPNTDVIMIGPGTGIAPFRAFMQQRQADEAEGKNWLFFGNPNYTQDFLYQTEWQRFVKEGVLTKVSLAFSRDQEQKVYVQHRIKEQGAELYQWLEKGAHLYICGDANHMAKDVHDALIHVVVEFGGKTAEQAELYLTDLRRAKRYQKDVY
ncbi:assimilatory sulfite reductase (NADPH) flavoprotein subunit [Paraglaciecola hydrolytica]|uniref:Sulfite reductase [NADPH] flavoprotein alpha-component n=1 Tax=Paraglaciecola hydrolytica TaxID=1799789 RepID=A0A136A2Q5_9ALTE|nr:assimilatory sulfite reductase (NADPH) flavoprotein subunit [Paraglaciecola hydrolytica]KXI29528.1 sulfite reductase [NADPH] flavoprotein alpha-component [Paraglaciecola hydrolytica]